MKLTTRISVLCFIYLGIYAPAISQTPLVDSLASELDRRTEQDTTRVNTLIDVVGQLYYDEAEKAKIYLEEADSLSELLDFGKGLADVNFYYGELEYFGYNYEKSLPFYEKSQKLYSNINDLPGVARVNQRFARVYSFLLKDSLAMEYNRKNMELLPTITGSQQVSAIYSNMSLMYLNQGENDLAIECLMKSNEIEIEFKDTLNMISNYMELVNVYDNIGNYPMAINYANKGVKINEELDSMKQDANALLTLGMVYYKKEDQEKALNYYQKALDLNIFQGNERSRAQTLYALGYVYKDQLKFDEALKTHNEALEIYKGLNADLNIARCLSAICGVYLENGESEKAGDYANEALEMYEKMNYQSGICGANQGLCRYYLAQKEYRKALKHGKIGYEIALENDLLMFKKEFHDLFFMIYEGMGDYQNALENHKIYMALSDSIYSEENNQKMLALEYEYKYENELAEASRREASLNDTVATTSQDLKKSQRNMLIAIILFLILAILSAIVIFYLKLKQVKAENKTNLTQQRLLRSQMTPHFIFNSLSILQGMILNKEEKKSVAYLSEFSKLLRTILENSRYKTVPLTEELKAIDSYMSLQNLDTNPPYQYELKLDPSVKELDFSIPPMLIQPFVENVVEHAFVEETENKELLIHVSYADKRLICEIRDNGQGVDLEDKKQQDHKNSLSTTITTERLESLSNEFDVKGSVKIKNRKEFNERGTLVTLELPYKINKAS